VLKGEVPIIVSANSVSEIKGALDLAEKFKLKLVINGGDEAVKLAKTLTRAECRSDPRRGSRTPDKRRRSIRRDICAGGRASEGRGQICLLIGWNRLQRPAAALITPEPPPPLDSAGRRR
jgi:hypothetical protein